MLYEWPAYDRSYRLVISPVSGKSRVPLPAARTIAFICVIYPSICCGLLACR
jgi:hypothetical protein